MEEENNLNTDNFKYDCITRESAKSRSPFARMKRVYLIGYDPKVEEPYFATQYPVTTHLEENRTATKRWRNLFTKTNSIVDALNEHKLKWEDAVELFHNRSIDGYPIM